MVPAGTHIPLVLHNMAAAVARYAYFFAAAALALAGLVWRWRRLAWAHLAALAWGVWIELSGGVCSLTPLENRLRRLGGEAAYGGDFVGHYLLPMLYPEGLDRGVQAVLAAAVLGLNAVVYWRNLRRLPHSARPPVPPTVRPPSPPSEA